MTGKFEDLKAGTGNSEGSTLLVHETSVSACFPILTSGKGLKDMVINKGMQYSIVTVEIREEGKAPDLRHYTFALESGSPRTESEIGIEALDCLKGIPGAKEVKDIQILSLEEYIVYLQNQLKDYYNLQKE